MITRLKPFFSQKAHGPERERGVARGLLPPLRDGSHDGVVGEDAGRVAGADGLGRNAAGDRVEVVDHLRLVAGVPRAVDAVLHVGPAVVHVDEVDTGKSGFSDHAVGELERVLRTVTVLGLQALPLHLRAEVGVERIEGPVDHDGLAVDGVVLRRLEEVVDPVARHADLVLRRVRARLVVVGVHHVPLEVAAVAGLVVGVDPVVEALVAAVPVPVHAERGDAVLRRPLDLPVHDLGVALVVPAEERLDAGERLVHLVPLGHLLRAGVVERVDLDPPPDGLRLRHARRVGARLRGRVRRCKKSPAEREGEECSRLRVHVVPFPLVVLCAIIPKAGGLCESENEFCA